MPRKSEEEKIYDRMTRDLPINSMVAKAIVKDEAGDNIRVFQSIRDDPLAGMKARNQIDDAQYLAGRKWQEYHDSCTIGGIKAIDPTKEAVDGGRTPEPITQRQVIAFRQIFLADKELGTNGGVLIRRILAQRLTIAQTAELMAGCSLSDRQIAKAGKHFRDCLDRLAILWGFAQQPNPYA